MANFEPVNIRVSIIEDELDFRDNLVQLLNNSEGFSFVESYSVSEDAIINIPNSNVDVVLVDIHLGGQSGIDCVEKLKVICPDVQFVMYTSFEDSNSVFKALKAGATGYITKSASISKILDSITDVFKGGSPMSSHIARKIVASFHDNYENAELKKLSIREKEILELLANGYRYKEIAGKLFLSTETVRTHIRNIYEKLQVNSRTDALNKVYKKPYE
jgi:DNA-binding NarL/FixJ family response regulator